MTLRQQLAYLREVIPDFDQLCELFVRKWLVMMEQRRVLRMGYYKLWFYTVMRKIGKALKARRIPKLKFLPWNAPLTDADHIFGLVNAIVLFRDIFGEYIVKLYHYQPDWYGLIEKIIFHEIGENKIGDWEDDGSHDLQKKWELEWSYFLEFISDFPHEARLRHTEQFLSVDKDEDEAKIFDKQAFLLGILYARAHDFEGDMTHSWVLSDLDKKSIKQTGSKRCFDNVYAGMLKRFQNRSWMPFFAGINESIYRMYYNAEHDPLVKNYVPGVVPAGVEQFYDAT